MDTATPTTGMLSLAIRVKALGIFCRFTGQLRQRVYVQLTTCVDPAIR